MILWDCERLSKMAPKRAHRYQDTALPSVESQEGDVGSLDAKFGNSIQRATAGVWGASAVDIRVKVYPNPAISRGFGVSVTAVEEEIAMPRPTFTLRVSEVRCSPRQSTQLYRTRMRLVDGSSKVRAESTFISVSKFACDVLRFCP